MNRKRISKIYIHTYLGDRARITRVIAGRVRDINSRRTFKADGVSKSSHSARCTCFSASRRRLLDDPNTLPSSESEVVDDEFLIILFSIRLDTMRPSSRKSTKRRRKLRASTIRAGEK